MGIADELQKLHDLHAAGALTDEEYARAKEALLAKPAPGVQDQLEDIARHQHAQELDRQWERERQQYMVSGTQGGQWVDGKHVGGYPVRYVPTKGSSLAAGVLAAVFGVVWMIVVGSMGHGAFQRDIRPGLTCPSAQLVVRDNVIDRGATPSPSGVPDPEHPIADPARPGFAPCPQPPT